MSISKNQSEGKPPLDEEEIIRNLPICGMIFEFKEMDQAKAFAAAVKEQFDLGSRVFDDAEAAARSHAFPWVQCPPVVHVDRPYWKLGDAWDDDRKACGHFAGT